MRTLLNKLLKMDKVSLTATPMLKKNNTTKREKSSKASVIQLLKQQLTQRKVMTTKMKISAMMDFDEDDFVLKLF